MADPRFHGKVKTVSASDMVTALADALSQIKSEDRLTWSDVGAVLGKSEDQAAKYADGSAVMDVTTFWRGRDKWGSRFTGQFDRLGARSLWGNDRHGQVMVLGAALSLSQALEDDHCVSESEVRAMRGDLERARDAIESQLLKIEGGK